MTLDGRQDSVPPSDTNSWDLYWGFLQTCLRQGFGFGAVNEDSTIGTNLDSANLART